MIRAVFARRRPGAGGVRRGEPGGTLRHRADALRRTDPALQLSRSGATDVRADGGDPRGRLHVRSQDVAAIGRALLARRDGRHGAVPPGEMLPKHIATCILSRIERLPPGDGLCHYDLHPGNVIMTTDGPRIIDWDRRAVRAPAALDLARAVTSAFPNSLLKSPNKSGAAAMRSMSPCSPRMRGCAGMSPAALTAAMAPYLPIARVHLLAGVAPARQGKRMIQRIEADLRSEDW